MDTKSKYKLLIKEYLAPFLIRHSIKQGSLSFYYIHNTLLLRALSFEADRFNYPGKYAFRINLNIVGLLNSIEKAKDLASIISAGNFPILTISISELAGNKLAAYYVDEATDLSVIASAIINEVQHYALPILLDTNSITDLEKILNDFEKVMQYPKYFFTMAIFLAMLGDKEKSKEYFLRSGGDKDVIAKTAFNYGINL